MTNDPLPDAATLALTLIRVFKGRIAVDNVPEHTGFDTKLASNCNTVESYGGFPAKELRRQRPRKQRRRFRSN